MKLKTLTLILLLISICSFGRKFYTLPKEEFVSQFSAGKQLKRLSCYNEAGQKVWLYLDPNSLLTLVVADKEINVLLQKTTFANGNITALRQTSFGKMSTFNIDDVSEIKIYAVMREQELPYFDMDSRRQEVGRQNDSLRAEFLKHNDHYVLLVSKDFPEDTIRILRDACYNLKFKNGDETKYGVVLRVTTDSIRISSCFDVANAAKSSLSYKILDHAISDISELVLAKSSGLGYKNKPFSDYNLLVSEVKREGEYPPCWYAMYSRTGQINFYRSWLTEKGFVGIMEEKGDIFWYEGGILR